MAKPASLPRPALAKFFAVAAALSRISYAPLR